MGHRWNDSGQWPAYGGKHPRCPCFRDCISVGRVRSVVGDEGRARVKGSYFVDGLDAARNFGGHCEYVGSGSAVSEMGQRLQTKVGWDIRASPDGAMDVARDEVTAAVVKIELR